MPQTIPPVFLEELLYLCKFFILSYNSGMEMIRVKRGQAGAATHTSLPEQVIYRYMKKAYRNTVSSYSPEWLRLYNGRKAEIDVYVPDLDLAIEYNGVRWHRGREWHDSEKEYVIHQNVKTLIVIKEPGLETIYTFADVFYINVPRLDPACKYMNEVIKEISKIIQKQYSIKMYFKANLSDELPKIRALLKQNQEERMLATVAPEIAAEWNYERNGDLSPNKVYAQSEKLVWWTCPTGHIYQEKVCHGGSCPVCRIHKGIKEHKYEFQNEKCAKCGVYCELEDMYGNVELQIERTYHCKMNTPPGYRLLCKECYQKRKKKIASSPFA
jgi:hypothetical protein